AERLVEHLLQRIDVLAPLLVAGEAWIVDERGHVERAAEPLEDRLRAGGHRDPFSVAGAKGVARRDDGKAAAVSLLHDAELVEVDDVRPEHREERLVDGEVHDLPAARALALAQRRQRKARAGEAGGRAGERETRQ